MKALIIVLLVLTVLMIVPVGIDGGYNGKSLILGIKFGVFNIRILPKKISPLKLEKQKISKKKKTKEPKKEKEPKQKEPLDKERLQSLIKFALKALGRFRKKLRVNFLRVRVTYATSDPFVTALAFGASNAVMDTLVPLIDDAFIIDKRDIGVSYDFLSDKPVFDFWLTTTIQIWEILYIALAFGFDLLKMKLIKRSKERNRKD